jgi:hypothetical protein
MSSFGRLCLSIIFASIYLVSNMYMAKKRGTFAAQGRHMNEPAHILHVFVRFRRLRMGITALLRHF